ncbi:hypothetical protein DFJ73DRAFT_86591 [Zopfochytrium polystomum]|nr:hypothetical protein DFJ73DRAFT_86591 [Zopfochytrium polystomum]
MLSSSSSSSSSTISSSSSSPQSSDPGSSPPPSGSSSPPVPTTSPDCTRTFSFQSKHHKIKVDPLSGLDDLIGRVRLRLNLARSLSIEIAYADGNGDVYVLGPDDDLPSVLSETTKFQVTATTSALTAPAPSPSPTPAEPVASPTPTVDFDFFFDNEKHRIKFEHGTSQDALLSLIAKRLGSHDPLKVTFKDAAGDVWVLGPDISVEDVVAQKFRIDVKALPAHSPPKEDDNALRKPSKGRSRRGTNASLPGLSALSEGLLKTIFPSKVPFASANWKCRQKCTVHAYFLST